jgi:hypothetical protein
MQQSSLLLALTGRGTRVPGARRKRARANPETGIVAACLKLLKLRGYRARRVNSGSVPTVRGRYQGAPAGTPDIEIIIPPRGRAAFVEVKLPGKKLRATQKKWVATYVPLGVLFGIATSATGCLAMVEQWAKEERAG